MAAVAVGLNSYTYFAPEMPPRMRTNFTHCLTLRIVPEMDALIADAAYDSRIPSKAAWIR